MKKIKLLLGLAAITTLGSGVGISTTACNKKTDSSNSGKMEDLEWKDENNKKAAYPVEKRTYTLIYYVLKIGGKKVDYSQTPVAYVYDNGSDAELGIWTDHYIFKVTPNKDGNFKLKLKITLYTDSEMTTIGETVDAIADVNVKAQTPGAITATKDNIDRLTISQDDKVGVLDNDTINFSFMKDMNPPSDIKWSVSPTTEDNSGSGAWGINNNGVLTISAALSNVSSAATQITVSITSESQPEVNNAFTLSLFKGDDYTSNLKFENKDEVLNMANYATPGQTYNFHPADNVNAQIKLEFQDGQKPTGGVWDYSKTDGSGKVDGLVITTSESQDVIRAKDTSVATISDPTQITIVFASLAGSGSVTFYCKMTN